MDYPRQRAKHLSNPKPSLAKLIGRDSGAVSDNRVLLQTMPSGYFMAGIGGSGSLLQVAFEDQECHDIAEALRRGDAEKARGLGIEALLGEIVDPDLRRLVIAEALLKASPDDPDHPGWPAGTEGGQGGEFRPKDTAASDIGHNQPPPDRPSVATEEARKRVAQIAARRTIRAYLMTALRIAATAAANLVPILGEVADAALVAELAVLAAQSLQLQIETDAALKFLKSPRTLDDLQVGPENEAFSSYDAFKKTDLEKRFGPAGAGYEYHHIVEQNPNRGGIPSDLLQNTSNIVRIPTIFHQAISAEYSKSAEEAPELTVRQWLKTQSYEAQRAYGLKVLRKLGILN